MIALKCDPMRLPEPLIPRTKARAKEIQQNELVQAITAELFDPFFEDIKTGKRMSPYKRRDKKQNTVFTKEVMETVMRMRADGKTFNEIGAAVGLNPRAVESKVYRDRKQQGLCECRFTPFTPEQDAVIRQMRAEGKLWKEIGEELGRSSGSVRKHAHKVLGL